MSIDPRFIVNLKGRDWQRDPVERFMEKVRYTAYGCWEWNGGHSKEGYARFSVGRRQDRLAHRWSFRFFKGPIPEGMEPDHLCRNRGCVNPDHLEAVTRLVNVRRGLAPQRCGDYQRAKTHCRNGHPYEGANLYRYPNGHRGCRTCNREAQKRYERRKAAR